LEIERNTTERTIESEVGLDSDIGMKLEVRVWEWEWEWDEIGGLRVRWKVWVLGFGKVRKKAGDES